MSTWRHTSELNEYSRRSQIFQKLMKEGLIFFLISSGTTALTFAIRNGNLAAVKELLKHPGINVNYQSKHGENALFEAVSYKRKDIVDLLLSHPQCEVDLVDQHDRTPFLVSCQYGYDDIACTLIWVLHPL